MKKKIMILDDDPEVLIVLSHVIKLLGYKSITANSAKSAFEKISSCGSPSLIICDLMMPKTDGIKFIKELKNSKNADIRSIPIIVLSAESDLKTRVNPLHVDYLSKKYELSELINLLSKYCS